MVPNPVLVVLAVTADGGVRVHTVYIAGIWMRQGDVRIPGNGGFVVTCYSAVVSLSTILARHESGNEMDLCTNLSFGSNSARLSRSAPLVGLFRCLLACFQLDLEISNDIDQAES